ncbi:DUF1571 domain-containing protein [bacterium]|nr:DUF1571 domain-containing protein [bacterium]
MKYKPKILIFLIISLLYGQKIPSSSADSILAEMSHRWNEILDCTCEMETYIKKGEVEQHRISEYKFKKPQCIWMKIISGDNAGAQIIYNPLRKKVIAKSGGFIGIIPISVSPENSMVRSIRGHRFDENHIGHIIERWKYYAGNYIVSFEENDTIYIMQVDSVDTSRFYGTFREKLTIDKTTLFPIMFEQYNANNELINEVIIRNVHINVGLKKSDFDFQ